MQSELITSIVVSLITAYYKEYSIQHYDGQLIKRGAQKAEILLKLALNTNQSINQSNPQIFIYVSL
jgi:hypothetical protein